MAQVGDIVRFLNSTGGGRVTRLQGNLAYVEDEDGFETPALIRECVVVGSDKFFSEPPKPKAETPRPQQATQAQQQPAAAVPEPVLPIEETEDGDKINLVLGYEPQDIKQPTTSKLDTYLVNDSNYYMSFTYMTRASESKEWQCRYAGTVEPNIQLLLEELDRSELGEMDMIQVQYVAYKLGKPFEQKQPMSIARQLDTTKFFKLHCYKQNEYFDNPVIALQLMRDDKPATEQPVDTKKLEEALNAKKRIDRQRRPVQKKSVSSKPSSEPIIVDLHIEELLDNTRGLSPADMLNLQVDEFRRIMDDNLKNKGRKIIFIHGKGEGVLRQALIKELNHRYKGHDVQDASFREYGFGATQVTIR